MKPYGFEIKLASLVGRFVAAFALNFIWVKNMNAVKQGFIVSFFAALFLLQSVSQLLPMHSMSESHPQVVSSVLATAKHADFNDQVSEIPAEHSIPNQALMTDREHTTPTMMTQGCELHCQTMAQNCAEIMCATLVFAESGNKPVLTLPMQSVNVYSPVHYRGYNISSLYRPPISSLS